jgi:hypothetical protein
MKSFAGGILAVIVLAEHIVGFQCHLADDSIGQLVVRLIQNTYLCIGQSGSCRQHLQAGPAVVSRAGLAFHLHALTVDFIHGNR